METKSKQKYAEELALLLKQVSDHLWEIDALYSDEPYQFDDQALMSALKIFSTVIFDKSWEYQDEKDSPLEDRLMFVEDIGKTLRELVKEHTGKDPWELTP